MADHSTTVIGASTDRGPLAASEIRAQLQRITRSSSFAGSERLRRFLTWTVEQTLRGHAETIKQYVIGQEVFDRRGDFDPRVDSIVRTEAGRLRRKLREYYASSGNTDPVMISYDPGSYVPNFRRCERQPPSTSDKVVKLLPSEKREPAVVVLPFENLTVHPDREYFCRGIAESIQECLAASPRLKVISSVSASRFRSAESDFRMASRLGVTTVVEGSVQQAAERIRIHAKALDLSSEKYVWARAFDRLMPDVFAIQDEIAASVATALSVRLLNLPGRGTKDPPSVDAYQLYLKGRHHWNRLSAKGCKRAIDYFTRAVLLYPDYARPYAGLAEAYLWLIFFGGCKPLDLVKVIRSVALRALDLDPGCAQAYIVLATLTGIFEARWSEAETLFSKGLELQPNYVPGYLQRGFLRLQTGNLPASGADVARALELDPLSVRCHRASGLRFYLQREYDGALSALDRALELEPEIRHSHYSKGLILLQSGQPQEAIASILKSLKGFKPTLYMGALAAAYAIAGSTREANEALQALHEQATRAFVSPIAFVHAYSGMGRRLEALDWLERATEEGYSGFMNLKLEPMIDCLRSDARFQTVLNRTMNRG